MKKTLLITAITAMLSFTAQADQNLVTLSYSSNEFASGVNFSNHYTNDDLRGVGAYWGFGVLSGDKSIEDGPYDINFDLLYIDINMGMNIRLHENFLLYGGIGLSAVDIETDANYYGRYVNIGMKTRDSDYAFNTNVGAIIQHKKVGLDLGYNTGSESFYVGLIYNYN